MSSDRTYAVPDLHGRRDLLDAAIATVESDAPGGGTLVFLGDYVDRGPHGAQVIDRLIAGPPEGWRWVCLKGNHEEMMSLALRDPGRLGWWIDNGGDATIASYDSRATIARDLAWIEALPSMHRDAHRLYVHAGVDAAVPLAAQADSTLLWKRYRPDIDEGHGDHHVVHGHDPDEEGPLVLSRRTGLDTYAWSTGRLAIGRFDDDRAGGPADILEVRAAPARRLAATGR